MCKFTLGLNKAMKHTAGERMENQCYCAGTLAITLCYVGCLRAL